MVEVPQLAPPQQSPYTIFRLTGALCYPDKDGDSPFGNLRNVRGTIRKLVEVNIPDERVGQKPYNQIPYTAGFRRSISIAQPHVLTESIEWIPRQPHVEDRVAIANDIQAIWVINRPLFCMQNLVYGK